MPTTLPFITDDKASPDMLEQFAAIEKIMGNVPPLLRILANIPPFVGAFMDLAGPVIMGQALSLELKTLALLRVSEINNCNYCRGYYAGLAEQVGIVGDKRAALNSGDRKSSLFSDKESIVLQLADEMTRDVQASPATVAEARKILGDHGVLEAMMMIGLFNLINRVARSSGLPLD